MNIEYSIVMPCLNEEQTLLECIRKARDFFQKKGICFEIIIADNGSTDNSIRIAQIYADLLVEEKRKGYGFALIRGLNAAHGKYIIIGDSDASYDFGNLDPFIFAFNQGADVIIGNRFAGGIYPNAMPWIHRYIGNPVLSGFARILFSNNIHDYHCGLRACTQKAYRKMKLQCGGMEFASEFIIKASLLNLRISEVPVILYPDGRKGKSHLQTWKDGCRHLFLIIRLFLENKYKK